MEFKKTKAVIVAHPDDETLWCGGELLKHPYDSWFIASLCRKNDLDRAPKFKKVLRTYHANGTMGDLNDEPEQLPFPPETVEASILSSLPERNYDLIITHSPFGEYTRHLRHEEVGKAVIKLWKEGKITTKALWLFAYEDGNKTYFPRAIEDADFCKKLPLKVWLEKYRIITEIYGFQKSGFEAKTTPEKEAFWEFKTAEDALKWFVDNPKNQNPFKHL